MLTPATSRVGGAVSEPELPAGAAGGVPGERETIERNLRVSQWAAFTGASLGALSAFASGNLHSGAILAAGAAIVGLTMALRRAGRLQLSAVVFQICLVSVIHALCWFGRGLQDTATILYPVAILTAALMLDRGLLAAATVACIASVAILAHQQQPGDPDLLAVFDVSLILIVTAVAVDLLVRGVLRGLAEARSKERRLAEAYAELEARNAELERFTSVVSHDLKSPLVTIRGFLDYVEDDARSGDHERVARDLERIRIAADRMGHLLDDLLELSRTGRIARPHEDLTFGEVVREARAVVGGRLDAAAVQVEVAPMAAAQVVRGDRARLVELMQNLLDNAAKFTSSVKEPRIAIRVREDSEGEPVFTVSDNGIGIEAVHHERVFDLFHKLDPSGEGTGLGLALVRRIVETHGGRIWVESEGKDRGTTFCFTLPAGSPDA
jgi:signal transduction histidine kinase